MARATRKKSAETAAEANKLALEKIYDNACCKKFRKKLQSKENS